MTTSGEGGDAVVLVDLISAILRGVAIAVSIGASSVIIIITTLVLLHTCGGYIGHGQGACPIHIILDLYTFSFH